MKIYLEQTEDGRRLFRADESDKDEAGPGRPQGWLSRKAHALTAAFQHSEGRLARTVRRGWSWLQRRMHPDEPLLVRLRSAQAIEIDHPATLPAPEARAAWRAHLSRAQRRHVPWLILNVLVSPLTILLAPLPGPNLVGYWIAYRAVRDWLAVRGARRGLSGRVETTFHPAGTRHPCDC